MEINISQLLKDLVIYTNNINKQNRQISQIETDYVDNQKKICITYFNLLNIDPIHAKATKNLNKNAILVNDYMFKILGWFVGEDRYTYVNIKSIDINNKNEITYFSVYGSNTEFGIWRLVAGSNIINFAPLYKGKSDYVQQTMIDINLQLFINKEINIITAITIQSDFKLYTDNEYSNVNEFMYQAGKNTPLTIAHIDDESRQLRIEPFITYNAKAENLCEYANDINDVYLVTIQTRLNELSDLIESNPGFEIVKVKSINDFHIDPYPILSMYFVQFKNSIILYYFTFTHTHPPTGNPKKYHTPLILTNNTAKITKYGTYSHYVLAGDYICKPAHGNPARNEKSIKLEYKGMRNRFLIADRYTNLYPYKLNLDLLIP